MFQEFPKMGRLTRDCVITEKIDGTNAQVFLLGKREEGYAERMALPVIAENEQFWMFAGSRTRFITPQDDNFGFAAWVKAHAEELFALGGGRHFGEWWGSGIQRGYGLPKGEKRFSLFNTGRWVEAGHPLGVGLLPDDKRNVAPACCHVVPVLYSGLFGESHANDAIEHLKFDGSEAAPGFMDPEGIVIFHTAVGTMFKKTISGDEEGKEQRARRLAHA